LWLAVRQYLTRMRQLDPQVGWAMAERLASEVAARTGAPAPQGVPPAAYLAAVVQERQVREARRAFGSGAATVGPAVAGAFWAPAPPSPAAASYPPAGVSYPAAAQAVVPVPVVEAAPPDQEGDRRSSGGFAPPA
jgi:hypothetical protein